MAPALPINWKKTVIGNSWRFFFKTTGTIFSTILCFIFALERGFGGNNLWSMVK